MTSTKQLFKFGITGFINTVLTYVIYMLLLHATNATIAMAIGYGITSLLGLTMSNRWVFQTGNSVKSVVWKYYATYLFTWLISVLFAHFASGFPIIDSRLIPIISLLITVPTNFLLSKFWVFHKTNLKEVRRYGSQ
ncbi:polysaccharide synthesis protein GtrA [Lentilactobacillus kefiri]|nr:GtrA family protein [Lentilactobacillus kefiri]MCP9368310.1 GtrA family protein [Lentilactobacillus kefiri]PAK60275.1 polysaccharide synthesis protein GtrA [Lentilactobacillus kefiri]PAK83765.1 polysaccharide synthesis protein GtrA [Lentilactobacillus kefiri]PAL06948.1 polysaccharide synthesis protein GtrA [Lentilactobacillus kefiri]QGV24113.1 GtrA family protein [Lentilactobacillus kefiri]